MRSLQIIGHPELVVPRIVRHQRRGYCTRQRQRCVIDAPMPRPMVIVIIEFAVTSRSDDASVKRIK